MLMFMKSKLEEPLKRNKQRVFFGGGGDGENVIRTQSVFFRGLKAKGHGLNHQVVWF